MIENIGFLNKIAYILKNPKVKTEKVVLEVKKPTFEVNITYNKDGKMILQEIKESIIDILG